jgi:hypothetical protein
MMNRNRPPLRPGPACAPVAPLLEQVVSQKRLHPDDGDVLQTHLETCDYCRSELESYRRLDYALARHFAPPARNPLSAGEINAIINLSYRPRSVSPSHQARPARPGSMRPAVPYQEPREPRRRRAISALYALAAALLIAVIGLAVFISHAHSPGAGTRLTSTPVTPTATLPPVSEVPYTPQSGDMLSSLSMTSTDEGWAVGNIQMSDTLILHYTGGQWKRVMGVPDNEQLHTSIALLSQVAMVSTTEGWAVGNLESEGGQGWSGLILHYTGGRWRTQEVIPDIELFSLAMVSASEGWAVGDTPYSLNPAQQGVLVQYTGGAWKRVPGFGNTLSKITMASPVDGWITGILQPGVLSTWHYNGRAWTLVNIPAFVYVGLISPVSASDVWAVGYVQGSSRARNALVRIAPFSSHAPVVFAHYDGKTWIAVQTPITGQEANIAGLFMDSANDGWVIGNIATSQTSEKMVYLHYTGGKWTLVNGPDNNGGYALCMLSGSEGWAVGDNGAILHYHQGTWSVALGG